MYQLRDYQADLTERVRDGFRHHRRVLMVLPTGGGKTVVFAYITQGAAAKGKRVIVVAHRTEIVGQISAALDSMGVQHGRIQPGHTMTDDAVQVAMIQTLGRRAQRITAPDFLVVDEVHHAVSDSYDAVCSRWPEAKILGVTATPQRLDGKGLGRMFEAMIIGPPTHELISKRWLAGFTYLAPPSQADLSAIHTRAGDYALDELAAAIDRRVITGDALEHYKRHIYPRSAIVFCVRVDHAEHVAEQFLEGGIEAASVDGTMDRATRRDRIEGLGSGKYKVLTSCALISEGLDVPSVGGVVLLRPTQSLALHLQQIGRALRPKPDGSKAIVLDHVGNVERHGLPDVERQWSLDDKKKREPADPVTQCNKCFRVFKSFPDWKAKLRNAIEDGDEDPCDYPDDEDCILHVAEAAPVEQLEVVSGELVELTASPAWAQGCDIIRARGQEWRALLAKADTYEKLRQIQRMRGYKPGWIKFIMEARGGRNRNYAGYSR